MSNEPVAWMNVWGDLLRHHPAEYGRNDEHEGWKPLYTQDDTALLRQALACVVRAKFELVGITPTQDMDDLIDALRERLEGQA